MRVVMKKAFKITVDNDNLEEVTLLAKYKRKELYTPFIMIGIRGYSRMTGKMQETDMIDELLKMTKPEGYLIEVLREDFDKLSHSSYVNPKNYSSSQKQRMLLGYKRLRAKDIVRRVRRSYYMFNPTLIIPAKDRKALLKEYGKLK